VIEVISKQQNMPKVVKKMQDYRRAGVQVIWHIFPENQEIHVYKGKAMTVCVGDDLCSAEPVIEGFVLPAKDVFK
jgi:Putative restriction endonuclease